MSLIRGSSIMRYSLIVVGAGLIGASMLYAEDPSSEPRPIPLTRPEMKKYIENMKQRQPRIPLPELTEEEKAKLGERGGGYEGRLRSLYLGDIVQTFGFGGGRPGAAGGTTPATPPPTSMTLERPFRTQMFWIVCRTNNCQYCLGHQEGGLLRSGQKEEEIAALDGDWAEFTPAQRAAFAFTRKVTLEPHKIGDADIADLRKHYKDSQILEIILSTAGNNAINRWKEGLGVPQGSGGGGGRREPGTPEPPRTPHTYVTPTPEKFQKVVTKVAPLPAGDASSGLLAKCVFTRAPLESREEVEQALSACANRKPRLPLVDEAQARALLPDDWAKGPLPQWVRLLANLPREGVARIVGQRSAETKGDLTPLLKAQVSWIVARQDRAWYALGLAKERLKALGLSDDEIYKLDGNWSTYKPAEQAMFVLARKLAASPVVLTDADVAQALKVTGPRDVVQMVNYVTVLASFDRITESAGLALAR